jgi:hypothetical protein
MQNVKLPIFINGSRAWLKLRPGQRLSWDKGERHDEGWSYYAETWELSEDGKTLTLETYSDSTGCDGRLSRGAQFKAEAKRESWRPNPFEIEWTPAGYVSTLHPDWIEAEAWQRDYAAEAMGY